MDPIVVLVRYQAQPDRVEEALAELAALIATVRAAEPDCGGITMIQDTADLARIQLVEHWPSPEAFLGPHLEQPHIQAFIARAPTFLAGPPDISFWRTAATA